VLPTNEGIELNALNLTIEKGILMDAFFLNQIWWSNYLHHLSGLSFLNELSGSPPGPKLIMTMLISLSILTLVTLSLAYVFFSVFVMVMRLLDAYFLSDGLC
jgi:hypothetical protein